MINHVRTLLANLPPMNTACSPMEEYIPPFFRPVVWPAGLIDLKNLFIGTHPDRWYVNWRVSQFMTVLLNGPLADWVTAYDSRLTIPKIEKWSQSFKTSSHVTRNFKLPMSYTILTPEEVDSKAITIINHPAEHYHLGRVRHFFEIKIEDQQLKITRHSPPSSEIFVELSGPSEGPLNSIDSVHLPGVNLSIRLHLARPGSFWSLEVLTSPQPFLSKIIKKVPEFPNILATLFNHREKEDQQLADLWYDPLSNTVTKLSAVLMAWARRAHEAWLSRNIDFQLEQWFKNSENGYCED